MNTSLLSVKPRFMRLFLIAMVSLTIASPFLLQSAQNARAAKDVPYILVDENTGTILKAHRENDRWYPASLTKLMTAWVTFRAIADGEIQPGSPVEISARAAKQPPSKMGYKIGTKLRVDTALKITIVKSANDVSLALAESVAGTEAQFIKRMNAEAERLGLTNTQYANANGLHNPNQYTTARDIAVLVHNIRTKFPQYAEWFATPAIKAGKKTYYSFDLLLERFPGTTGMKTGFVCASGYNLASTVTRNGKSLISVVLGRDSQTDRAVSAAKLLSEGFSGSVSAMGNVNEVPTGPSAKPRNMRGAICSEAARKARIDLMPQDMVIKSQYLQPRKTVKPPLVIATGGVDAPPSPAFAARMFMPKGKVPVPARRPQFTIRDVDGTPISSADAIPASLRTSLPIPTQKPQSIAQ